MFFSKEQFENMSEEIKRRLIEVGGVITESGGIILNENKNIQGQLNPNFPTQVKNFAGSMGTWAGSGFKRVQQHVYEKRLAICRKCQFWQENGNMGMGKCLKCGCGKGKHWLPHEQCPIGLWGKEQ
jgi:hypothetical protein